MIYTTYRRIVIFRLVALFLVLLFSTLFIMSDGISSLPYMMFIGVIYRIPEFVILSGLVHVVNVEREENAKKAKTTEASD